MLTRLRRPPLCGAAAGTTVTGRMPPLPGSRLYLGTLAFPELSIAAAAGRLLSRGTDLAAGASGGGRLIFTGLVNRRTAHRRRAVPLPEHVWLLSVEQMFQRTDATRWTARLLHHVARRLSHYHRCGFR